MPAMLERLVAAVQALADRLADVELALATMQETKKYEQEKAPTGTELCGSLYRRGSRPGELTIVKNYDGPCGDDALLAVTCDDHFPCWWHSVEWARGEVRTWVDDAVEAVIGVERAKAVRARCLELLEAEEEDPDNLEICCMDLGLDSTSDLMVWWLRTAVAHRVPEVRDLGPNYLLLRPLADVGIEMVVRVVDLIFDLCAEPRTPVLEVHILPEALTDLAGAKECTRSRSEGDDPKKLWAGMTPERREKLKTEARHWTARRDRMTPDQRRVDDRDSFVKYDLLMAVVANA